MLQRLRAFWTGEVDFAPLGLFRIAFGALLFNYFWQLFPNLTAFFTDEGFLPRRLLFAHWIDRPSVLTPFGDWWQIVPFWVAGLVVSVLILVGLRTRLAALIGFVLIVSFQWRDPLVVDGSDFVLRLCAFWLIFTNAAHRYGLDGVLARARGEPVTGRGWALPVRLLELQIALVYLTTALEKLGGTTWLDGQAIYYALQLPTWSRSYSIPVAQNLAIDKVLSWGTLGAELSFLPLVFFPVFNRITRLLGVAATTAMHLGIAVLMNVGNFPAVMIGANLLFLPTDIAEAIVRLVGLPFRSARATVYYDGACAFCTRTARILEGLDLYRTVRLEDFRALSSLPPQLTLASLEKRIAAIDSSGGAVYGIDAIALIGRGVPLLLPLHLIARVPLLHGLLDRAYDAVAARRFLLIQCDGEPCGEHAQPRPRAARSQRPRYAAGALLAIVALVSFATAIPPRLFTFIPPGPVGRALVFTTLDQRWNMFSPDPPAIDGAMSVQGRLTDGSLIDLRTGKQYSSVPHYNDAMFSRWARANYTIAFAGQLDFFAEYAQSFCRAHNLHPVPGQPPVSTVQLWFTEVFTPAPGGAAIAPMPFFLANADCGVAPPAQ